jgi:GNAT superfamily N-acetyltransferase
VAEENGEILGAGSAEIRPAKDYLAHSHYVYLGFMFTRPEARGKGVNKKILDELMDWSRTKGIKEIRLEVYAGNAVARQAYEKSGFKDHLIEMRFESGESFTSI